MKHTSSYFTFVFTLAFAFCACSDSSVQRPEEKNKFADTTEENSLVFQPIKKNKELKQKVMSEKEFQLKTILISESQFQEFCSERVSPTSILTECACSDVLEAYKILINSNHPNHAAIRGTDIILGECCNYYDAQCREIEYSVYNSSDDTVLNGQHNNHSR